MVHDIDAIDWEERLKQLVRPVWRGRTQAKYAVLAARIRELARGAAPGTQLPTVRRLAKAFGVTVPPVQKALRELDRAGLITVRHGCGSFVAGEEARAMPFGLSLEIQAKVRCRIQSNNATQMEFWRETAERFAAAWPGVTVDVIAATQATHPTVDDVDLVEISSLQWPLLMASQNLVRLRGGNAPENSGSGTFFPHQSQLFCLYYNLDHLDRLGIDPPAFTDFTGQLEWWRRRAARAGGNQDSPLVSTQQPIFLMGEWFEVFGEWLLAEGDAPIPEGAMAAILSINALTDCSRQLAPACGDLACRLFFRGEAAAMQGFLYNFGDVAATLPEGRWGYCPIYAVDDTIPCEPVGFAVRRDSPRVTAALRFVTMLQQDPWQEHLLDHHMAPVDTSRFRGGAMPDAWKRTAPIRFRSALEASLWTNVVTPEWWRWRRGGMDTATFLADCRRFSAVLAAQPGQNVRQWEDMQDAWV